LIICADDFGISKSVSDGILDLLSIKRLSAVSCIMNYKAEIPSQLNKLVKYRKECDIGLHLNLTNGRPVSNLVNINSGLVDKEGFFLDFKNILFNIITKKIDQRQLVLEIENQIDCFKELTGFNPDFIDGHQHIQQLPTVSDILLQVSKRKFNKHKYYIRAGEFPFLKSIKSNLNFKMIIGSVFINFFSKQFIKKLKINNIHHNKYLFGYHNYNFEKKFLNVFLQYLEMNPSTNDIFFMHPGYIDSNLIFRDNLVEGRLTNLEFLKSDDFFKILESFKLRINRFNFDVNCTAK